MLAQIDWYYENKGGAEFIFPDEWERYLAPIPPAQRGSVVKAYNKMLTSEDREERMRAAKAWTTWEMATSYLAQSEESLAKGEEDEFAEAFARIENHYFINEGWFKPETCAARAWAWAHPAAGRRLLPPDVVWFDVLACGLGGEPCVVSLFTRRQLLDNVEKIRHIPCVIVQGRYDVVCPMRSAWDLHRAWCERHFAVLCAAPRSPHTIRASGSADSLYVGFSGPRRSWSLCPTLDTGWAPQAALFSFTCPAVFHATRDSSDSRLRC